MPLKSALLRDFGGCCFCNTIRACFLWLLEVTYIYFLITFFLILSYVYDNTFLEYTPTAICY